MLKKLLTATLAILLTATMMTPDRIVHAGEIDPQAGAGPSQGGSIFLPVVINGSGPAPEPQTADLSITQTVSSPEVTPGQQVTFTIQALNNGPASANTVVTAITLSSNLSIIDANSDLGSFNSITRRWSIPAFSSGADARLDLTVLVNPNASGSISSTVSISAAQTDPSPANNSASTTALVIQPTGVFISDDFNYYPGLKENLWTFINPKSDATVRVDGSHARISVPGGSTHNAANSPRIVQDIDNADFDVSVKFDSKPTGTYAIQGIMVEQSPTEFFRFEYFSFESTLYVYLARVQNGNSTELKQLEVTTSVTTWPMYLRARRAGTNFSFYYSTDGTNWTSFNNGSDGISVDRVGIYAGNAGGSTAPAFETAIDVANHLAAPVNPEDPIHPSFLFSDDFKSGELDTGIWSLVNPLGVEVLGFTGSQARLSVPEGLEHDIWTGSQIFAPRLMQATNNRNFSVDVKFDSMPQGTYTAQGFLVQQDDNDLLQYYLYSHEVQLRIFASLVVDGVEQKPYLIDDTVPTERISGAPMLLRIVREGDWWILSYGNGSQWWQAVDFHAPLVSNELGIVVGNEDHGDNGQVPPFTALIDYFQNNDMPLSSHD